MCFRVGLYRNACISSQVWVSGLWAPAQYFGNHLSAGIRFSFWEQWFGDNNQYWGTVYSAYQPCVMMPNYVLCVYFTLLCCPFVWLFIIALLIFLLDSLARLLPTQQIFPKHSGLKVADSIDLRIWSTDNQCFILYPRLSDEGREDAVYPSRDCQSSGQPY